MKKFFSILITLCFLLNGFSVYASSGDLNNNCTWSFDKGVLTISGSGSVEFNNNAWKAYNNLIERFCVSEGITEIKGNSGISNMTSIKELVLPSSLKIIGEAAFNKYPLESVDIPYGVTTIYDGAFEYSNLKTVVIPSSVTKFAGVSWYGGAFAYSQLESAVLPENIVSIDSNIFEGCKNLKAIEIPASVVNIKQGCFQYCESLEKVTFKGNKVSLIDYSLFNGCTSLTSVNLPDGISEIRGNAFKGCKKLTKIDIPDSVTLIGFEAFKNCESLNELTIPDKVTQIHGEAFRGISEFKLTILNPTCSIGEKQWFDESSVVYGYDWSTAQAFAKEYGYKFVSLGEYSDKDDNSGNSGEADIVFESGNNECTHTTYTDEYNGNSEYSPIDGNDTHHSAVHSYNRTCNKCGVVLKTLDSQGENQRHNFSGDTCTDCGYKKEEKKQQLAAPILEAPELDGDTYYTSCGNDVTIKWSSVSNADYYSVILWDSEADRTKNNNNFSYIVHDTESLTATLPGKSSAGLYAYSVYACSRTDTSIQSKPCSFNVHYSKKEDETVISEQDKRKNDLNVAKRKKEATGEIPVVINGKAITFDVPPQIINSRTMLPMRAIFEALGMTVEWNGQKKEITAYKDSNDMYNGKYGTVRTTLTMTIGDARLFKEITFNNGQTWLDGCSYKMDTPPQIINSRTLVPVRAISEALGCEVEWIADIGAVIIN